MSLQEKDGKQGLIAAIVGNSRSYYFLEVLTYHWGLGQRVRYNSSCVKHTLLSNSLSCWMDRVTVENWQLKLITVPNRK